VLEEARDIGNPPLGQIKSLATTAHHADEFVLDASG